MMLQNDTLSSLTKFSNWALPRELQFDTLKLKHGGIMLTQCIWVGRSDKQSCTVVRDAALLWFLKILRSLRRVGKMENCHQYISVESLKNLVSYILFNVETLNYTWMFP